MTNIQEIKYAYTYRVIQDHGKTYDLREELFNSKPTRWHLSFDQVLRYALEEANLEGFEVFGHDPCTMPVETVIEGAEMEKDEDGNMYFEVTLPWDEDVTIIVYRMELI
jgi:hypothetical protein